MREQLRNSYLPESCLEYQNPRNPPGYIALFHSSCFPLLLHLRSLLLPSFSLLLCLLQFRNRFTPHPHLTNTHTRGCSRLAPSSQNTMAPSLSICTLRSPSTQSASPTASAEYPTHSTQSERHLSPSHVTINQSHCFNLVM